VVATKPLSPPGRPQAASLDKRTELRRPSSGAFRGWSLAVHEGTGEAVAWWSGGPSGTDPADEGDERTPEERQQDNEARSARRRRSQIRRFCAANQLVRLWTLTYAEAQFSRETVLRDCAAFTRRFYEQFGTMPWLRVLELHKGGWCEYCSCDHPDGRYHVHLALPKIFLPVHVMESLWGHGFVHYRDRADRKVGEKRAPLSQVQISRLLARYLAKYVAKECEAGFGQHAYEVAQGYEVRRRVVRHILNLRALHRVVNVIGQGVQVVELSSASWLGYRGPPVFVYFFDEAHRGAGGRPPVPVVLH
jgi:hypothetical protein